MTALSDIVVPLLSILVGAVITYAVNVADRGRRRVEDVLAHAIGAVATVIATSDFVQRVEWQGASPADQKAMDAEVARDSVRAWVKAVADARVAVAHASAYVPELAVRLRASPNAFTRDADETLALLHAALSEAQKRWWRASASTY
ncbi:hypothetical protein [Actinotalea sp. JY-7885]|uniref:hypothetical protein n=1 Tax=Actinotalea sp. JY-7885 TaxID=2758576 RepID=UPI00165E2A1B|nr:hypothetical protein [Actinotalea sp. JY-7885]